MLRPADPATPGTVPLTAPALYAPANNAGTGRSGNQPALITPHTVNHWSVTSVPSGSTGTLECIDHYTAVFSCLPYYGGPYQIGPTVHTKTYTFRYYYY